MIANDPTGVVAGEPYTFRPGDIDEGPLPQRIKGATLTPEYLADIDAPVPYVPVDLDAPVPYAPVPMGIEEYECPEAGCDFHVYEVGPDAAPGYLDDMRQEIEDHKERHARDASTPHASSSTAGVAALRFSHPAPLNSSGGAVPKPNPAPSDDTTISPASVVIHAAMQWDEVHQADAAAVTPLQVFDADDALHMAVAAYRKAVRP